mmetsp:Transcript_12965/g.13418  ORF Transcript_12965/g.13418 Transcript_12965/m.13418 type:complete len:103 (+) Transcript_12965:253-561(+)
MEEEEAVCGVIVFEILVLEVIVVDEDDEEDDDDGNVIIFVLFVLVLLLVLVLVFDDVGEVKIVCALDGGGRTIELRGFPTFATLIGSILDVGAELGLNNNPS